MTLHRVFIAVELGEQVRRRAGELQERMRAAGARLRWVKPGNLHFTLRFLGEIPLSQLARATVAAREVAGATPPFSITISGLNAFPSFQRPQVVWVGTSEGAEALQGLADRLGEALIQARFPPEGRRFQPHLTLGRARDDRQWGDLVRALQQFRETVIGTDDVDAVTVMESRLTPEGPIYTARERIALGHGLTALPA